MTPAKEAKIFGFKSLKVVMDISGKSRETLGNWCKYDHDLFMVVLEGCMAILNRNRKSEDVFQEWENAVIKFKQLNKRPTYAPLQFDRFPDTSD